MRTDKVITIALALTAIAVTGACHRESKNRPTAKKVERRFHLKAVFGHKSWKGDEARKAMMMALAAPGIPMSRYHIRASADGKNYEGMLVGSSPFDRPLRGATINAIVVPLKINIGGVIFDPTAPDCRDPSTTALRGFRESPLVNYVPNLTMDGVNVGDSQFSNGLRRAEFWKVIKGAPTYQNDLRFFYADPVEVDADASNGIVDGAGCEQYGTLNENWFDPIVQAKVGEVLKSPGMPSQAVVLYLLRNVMTCETYPPAPDGKCALGYHWVIENTRQTYMVIDWDTSGQYAGQVSDASVASHEIAEWMDDPLGTNETPPWGNLDQYRDCSHDLEVGDPLTGILMPPTPMSGRNYQMQEMAFFSWFFNKRTAGSVGANGQYSSNGTRKGPAKLCPPGGTN